MKSNTNDESWCCDVLTIGAAKLKHYDFSVFLLRTAIMSVLIQGT
jgi:hypothetical protein